MQKTILILIGILIIGTMQAQEEIKLYKNAPSENSGITEKEMNYVDRLKRTKAKKPKA